MSEDSKSSCIKIIYSIRKPYDTVRLVIYLGNRLFSIRVVEIIRICL